MHDEYGYKTGVPSTITDTAVALPNEAVLAVILLYGWVSTSNLAAGC